MPTFPPNIGKCCPRQTIKLCFRFPAEYLTPLLGRKRNSCFLQVSPEKVRWVRPVNKSLSNSVPDLHPFATLLTLEMILWLQNRVARGRENLVPQRLNEHLRVEENLNFPFFNDYLHIYLYVWVPWRQPTFQPLLPPSYTGKYLFIYRFPSGFSFSVTTTDVSTFISTVFPL